MASRRAVRGGPRDPLLCDPCWHRRRSREPMEPSPGALLTLPRSSSYDVFLVHPPYYPGPCAPAPGDIPSLGRPSSRARWNRCSKNPLHPCWKSRVGREHCSHGAVDWPTTDYLGGRGTREPCKEALGERFLYFVGFVWSFWGRSGGSFI